MPRLARLHLIPELKGGAIPCKKKKRKKKRKKKEKTVYSSELNFQQHVTLAIRTFPEKFSFALSLLCRKHMDLITACRYSDLGLLTLCAKIPYVCVLASEQNILPLHNSASFIWLKSLSLFTKLIYIEITTLRETSDREQKKKKMKSFACIHIMAATCVL